MASVNKVILIGNLGKDPGDALPAERRRGDEHQRRHDRHLEGQERREAGAHRVASRRVLRQDRRDRGRVPEERLAGLRRRPYPHAQVAGQGRPGPLFDRDRRRPHAAPRRARRRRAEPMAREPATAAHGRRRRRRRPRRAKAARSTSWTTTFRSSALALAAVTNRGEPRFRLPDALPCACGERTEGNLGFPP